ncbi:MAG: RNA-binding protein [Planctomycetes bacterium]|nr:RNA-binding protein [Planctomycetota bacterium]
MSRRAAFSIAVVVALIALILVILRGCDEEKETRPEIDSDKFIPGVPAPRAFKYEIPFTDDAGIDFVHFTGSFVDAKGGNSRYLPECMGPGVVLFDADGDEHLDLFVANGTTYASDPQRTERGHPTSRFFRGLGDLKFADATKEVGLALELQGTGGAAADIDSDGDQDLLITGWGGLRLFRNDGTRFTDVTANAGLATRPWTDKGGHQGPDWSTSAAFFDCDRDGDLDLFVCNYAKWCPANDVFDSVNGIDKSFAIPRKYEGNTCRLFRNDGQGVFEDVTEQSGILSKRGKAKSLGVALWDFNRDGILDIVVANDAEPNFLYLSTGPGRYEERAQRGNIGYDENGRTRAGMGIAAADYLNDGVAGIPIGNFAGEPVALYRQQGESARFRDVTQQVGVSGPTQKLLTFGLLWADLDLDGLQDIVLANGHLEPDIQEVKPMIPYRQRLTLLRNMGRSFRDWTNAAGPGFRAPLAARGLATADLDQDGDLDLVVGDNASGIRILRNDQDTGHHWLRVELTGKKPNLDAIGAMVVLEADGITQRRLVHTGSSYASQSELVVTFGLGRCTKIDQLTVVWPDGKRQVVPGASVDRVVMVIRSP